MDTYLLVLFYGAVASNIGTAIMFHSRRDSLWLLLTPWIGIALGATYLVACRTYFAQPEVQLGVPIRVDAVLLPPLMAFSIFAGGARILRSIKRNKEKME